jgi:hypothetical protein
MSQAEWSRLSRIFDFILQQPTSKQEAPKEPVKRKPKKKRMV